MGTGPLSYPNNQEVTVNRKGMDGRKATTMTKGNKVPAGRMENYGSCDWTYGASCDGAQAWTQACTTRSYGLISHIVLSSQKNEHEIFH